MPAALVTGASRGLGRFCAQALAEKGYSVAINYRASEEEARETARAIGGDAFLARGDVGDAGEMREMAVRIEAALGRLDVIVNNAGIAMDNLLLRQSEEEWDAVIGTNLRGCFNVIRTMAPVMIKSGGGHIVNISSISGVRGKAGQAAYSASKAALLGLTVTAAAELAEYNIRVNAVLPGYMTTDMGGKATAAMKAARKDSLLGRLSDPCEVASFVLYLIGTKNITGQVFSLDSRVR